MAAPDPDPGELREVAHDILNGLTAIYFAAETIRQRVPPTDPDVEESLQTIARQVDELTALVRRLVPDSPAAPPD